MEEMFMFEPEDDVLLFDPDAPMFSAVWWDVPVARPNRDEEILLF
jgi:hypothetical protein